jgi:hypothetical protein
VFVRLLPAEVLERRRAQLRVARGVLHRSMAEPILNAPRHGFNLHFLEGPRRLDLAGTEKSVRGLPVVVVVVLSIRPFDFGRVGPKTARPTSPQHTIYFFSCATHPVPQPIFPIAQAAGEQIGLVD